MDDFQPPLRHINYSLTSSTVFMSLGSYTCFKFRHGNLKISLSFCLLEALGSLMFRAGSQMCVFISGLSHRQISLCLDSKTMYHFVLYIFRSRNDSHAGNANSQTTLGLGRRCLPHISFSRIFSSVPQEKEGPALQLTFFFFFFLLLLYLFIF